MALSISPELPRTLLIRSLRREGVQKIVGGLKLVCGGLALLCALLLSRDVIAARIAVSTAATKLDNEVFPGGDPTSKPTSPTTVDYNRIASKAIFGELGQRSAGGPAPKAVTKLPLILIGTYVSSGDDDYAIIEDDKKKVQDVFQTGQMVFGDAKLTGIFPDRVELSRGSQIEILKLDDMPDPKGGGGASSAAGDDIVVEEAELNKALENLPLLLTQARAVPYFKDGKSTGLRLFAIKAGSLYEKVGLQNGDILKSINGNSLGDISQAMKLFEMLKSERSLSVVVERNREERELRYQIR